MSDLRSVVMTAEQAAIIEKVGVELMRLKDERAMKVLSLSLAYKFAKTLEPELPSNVVEIDRWSRKAPCS